MTVKERCDLAKQHRLCYNCLKPGHSSLKCKLERRCCFQGCGRKHTKFLHRVSTYNAGGQQAHTGESTASSAIAEMRVVSGHIHMRADSVRFALPIVPVMVYNPVNQLSMSMHTFALLDTGSTNSFCTDNRAYQLGLSGHEEMLSLNTLEREIVKAKQLWSRCKWRTLAVIMCWT